MTPNEFTKSVLPRVLSNKNFNKIFCIGYNKTGTTTLGGILKLYGYKLPNQQEQEIRLSASTFKTNYTELKYFCSMYDAFQDMPFSQGLTYVVADALFPNSRFILTERPADAWFDSMCKFHKKKFKLDSLSELTEKDVLERFNYLYTGYSYDNKRRLLSSFESSQKRVNWEKLYDREWYTEMYQRRNEEIKRYFMNAPEKLLTIDITNEKTTKKICEFLDVPGEFVINTPHLNKT
jgi:hypothetical protein